MIKFCSHLHNKDVIFVGLAMSAFGVFNIVLGNLEIDGKFEYDEKGILIICQGILMITCSFPLVLGAQLERQRLLIPYMVLEVYGISAVVNSVLILYQFENNDTAYTDNPIAVLFGVAILLFMLLRIVFWRLTFGLYKDLRLSNKEEEICGKSKTNI